MNFIKRITKTADAFVEMFIDLIRHDKNRQEKYITKIIISNDVNAINYVAIKIALESEKLLSQRNQIEAANIIMRVSQKGLLSQVSTNEINLLALGTKLNSNKSPS